MASIRRILFFAKLGKNNLGILNYALRRGYHATGDNNRRKKFLVAIPFMASGVFGFIKKSEKVENSVTTKEVVIAKADALFDEGKYQDIYNLLNNYRDSGDVEILWRLCRAIYNMSKSMPSKEAEIKILEGYDLALKAVNLDDTNWAVHKWFAVMLNSKTEYEGIKSKVRELHKIKEHMMRASELNPLDATTLYMIGNWCYQISELAWYQRKLAAAIFGEPPTSSFEEALGYFERAESIQPEFYSHNLLMLGKTYMKLNKNEEALKYLTLASKYVAKNDDDHIAQQEAVKLLKKI